MRAQFRCRAEQLVNIAFTVTDMDAALRRAEQPCRLAQVFQPANATNSRLPRLAMKERKFQLRLNLNLFSRRAALNTVLPRCRAVRHLPKAARATARYFRTASA